jgi:hypothetical protein
MLYGAVPPLGVTVTVEVPPLQATVVALEVADNAVAGCVIVTLVGDVQPL